MTTELALVWLREHPGPNGPPIVQVGPSHVTVYHDWRDFENGIVWVEDETLLEAVEFLRSGLAANRSVEQGEKE